MVRKKEQTGRQIHSQSANARATVRVGPLTGIPVILRELGCAPEQIFQAGGFELSQFDDPDTKIPFVRAGILMERCTEATGCDRFGLMIGERVDPSSLGLAGFMLRVAPDVGTALRALLRHIDLHDQGGTVTLAASDDIAMLGYQIHLPEVHASAQILDLSISIACKIMRGLCGADWNPTRVFLSRPEPKDTTAYENYFQAPVQFNADESTIVFPSHWLQERLPGTDPILFDYLERQAVELHRHQTTDLIENLRQFIRASLSERACFLTAAARHLGMHPRTLNRQLLRENTSFRHEMNNIRYEIAREFLTGSKATNVQIASLLGYSDATAFNRSFKQWSGMTPTNWRARHAGH